MPHQIVILRMTELALLSQFLRFLDDSKMTNVILADSSQPILAKIPNFVNSFQDRLDLLKADYQQGCSKGKLDENGWYRGYRMITGNRYEVNILGNVINDFQDYLDAKDLIRFAQGQAIKDARIAKMSNRFFSEWSMILNDEEYNVQQIHIDVPENNFQFGLILDDNTKGIIVIQESIGPDSPEELLELVMKDAPFNLKECILKNFSVKSRMQNLLTAYGSLLWPRDRLQKAMVGSETLKKHYQS